MAPDTDRSVLSILALSLFDELKAISIPAKKAESKSDDTITMKIVIYTSEKSLAKLIKIP
jgi:hypothetical protein